MYLRNTCFKVGMSYGRHVQHEVRFYRMAYYAGEHVLLEGMLCCVFHENICTVLIFCLVLMPNCLSGRLVLDSCKVLIFCLVLMSNCLSGGHVLDSCLVLIFGLILINGHKFQQQQSHVWC